MPHHENNRENKFRASAEISLTRSALANSFVRRPVPDKPNNNWWSPLRRGLVFEPNARHYNQMKQAVWLYLYCLVNADAQRGTLFRKISTVSKDTGIPTRTIRRWLGILTKHQYIEAEYNGSFWQIAVTKWRPITAFSRGNGNWFKRLKGNLFNGRNH